MTTAIHDSLLEEVSSVQKEVVQKLTVNNSNKDQADEPCVATGVLLNINDYPIEVVEEYLGDIGKNIYRYNQLVNPSHPALKIFLNEFVESKLIHQMGDTLKISEYAKKVGAEALIKFLKYNFNQRKVIKDSLIQHFQHPPIRAIRDKDKRDVARKHGVAAIEDESKRKEGHTFKNIVLVSKEDEESNTTFAGFVRYSSYYLTLEKKHTSNYEKFVDMGLPGLATSFMEQVRTIQRKQTEHWMGFKRLSITGATAMLGKLHGFDWTDNNKYTLSDNPKLLSAVMKMLVPNQAYVSRMENTYKVGLDKVNVGKDSCYDILISIGEKIKRSEENKDEVILSLNKNKLASKIHYNARLYPLHAFEHLLSADTSEAIKVLETFPEYSGFPVFDEYLVLVPGASFELADFIGEEGYVNSSGEKFSTAAKMNYSMDCSLIKEKLIYPIILGVSDDSYYFISYLS